MLYVILKNGTRDGIPASAAVPFNTLDFAIEALRCLEFNLAWMQASRPLVRPAPSPYTIMPLESN